MAGNPGRQFYPSDAAAAAHTVCHHRELGWGESGMNELSESAVVHCASCATPMQGELCHHCGQSIHSVLKPMHHMLEETAETFVQVDGRMVRTLPPLLLKPGFFTRIF